MASKRYPLGIQTFSEIVKGNYFYADKTAIVYQLLSISTSRASGSIRLQNHQSGAVPW